MAKLEGQTIAASYDQLLHVDTEGGGNTTTLVPIKDGDNDTTFCLQLATTKAMIEGNGSTLYFYDEGGEHISADNAGNLTIAAGAATDDLITLDSTGYIALNADGDGTVIFEDASLQYGIIENSSSDFVIRAGVQDKDLVFKGNDGGNGITAMTIDMSAGGNVGIGIAPETTAGTALELGADLSLVDAGNGTITLYQNTYTDGTERYKNERPACYMRLSAGETLFRRAASSAEGEAQSFSTTMVIDGSGNVGIGDLTPNARLDVEGDSADYLVKMDNGLSTSNANRYGIYIMAGADDGGGTTYYLNCADGNGDDVGYIANISSTFALTDPSDSRLKKNIVDTSVKGLEAVSMMKVRDFEWKKSGDKCIGGFIAQELKEAYAPAVSGEDGEMQEYEVSPAIKAVEAQDAVLDEDGNIVEEAVEAIEAVEAVMGEKIKPMGVARDVLVPVLVKAIQELSAKVEALENA